MPEPQNHSAPAPRPPPPRPVGAPRPPPPRAMGAPAARPPPRPMGVPGARPPPPRAMGAPGARPPPRPMGAPGVRPPPPRAMPPASPSGNLPSQPVINSTPHENVQSPVQGAHVSPARPTVSPINGSHPSVTTVSPLPPKPVSNVHPVTKPVVPSMHTHSPIDAPVKSTPSATSSSAPTRQVTGRPSVSTVHTNVDTKPTSTIHTTGPNVRSPTNNKSSTPLTASGRTSNPITGRTSNPTTASGRVSTPTTSGRSSNPITGRVSTPTTTGRTSNPTTASGRVSTPTTTGRTSNPTLSNSRSVPGTTSTRSPSGSQTISSPKSANTQKNSPIHHPGTSATPITPINKSNSVSTSSSDKSINSTSNSISPSPITPVTPVIQQTPLKPVQDIELQNTKNKEEFEKRLNTLKSEYEEREEVLKKDMEGMKASYSQSIDVLNAKVQEFSSIIMEKDSHINQLRSQINSPGIVSSEIKKLIEENSQLKLSVLENEDAKQQLEALNKQYEELNEKYMTACDDNKQLKAYNKELEDYSEEVENELASILENQDVVRVNSSIDTLASTLSAPLDIRTKEELNEQNIMLFDTLKSLQKQKETNENKLKEQISSLVKEVEEMSAYNTQLYIARKSLKEKDEEIKQLKLTLESIQILKVEYDKIVEDNIHLQEEHAAMKQEYLEMTEIDRVNSETIEVLESIRLDYEDKFKKMEGNINVSKTTIQELETIKSQDIVLIDDLNDRIKELQKTIEKMEDEQNQEYDEDDESVTPEQLKATLVKKTKENIDLHTQYQFLNQDLILQTWRQEYLTSLLPVSFIDECLLYINKLIVIRGSLIHLTELWKNVMNNGYEPAESRLSTSYSSLLYSSELYYLITVYMTAITSNYMNQELFKQSLQTTSSLFADLLNIAKTINTEYIYNKEIRTACIQLSQLVDLLKPHVLMFIEQGDATWREFVEHEMGSHLSRCCFVLSLQSQRLMDIANETLISELEDRPVDDDDSDDDDDDDNSDDDDGDSDEDAPKEELTEEEKQVKEAKKAAIEKQKNQKIRGYSYNDILTMINNINDEFSDRVSSIETYAKTLLTQVETASKDIVENACGNPTGADVVTKSFVGIRKEAWTLFDDLEYAYNKFNSELFKYCSKEEGNLLYMLTNGVEGVQVKYRDAFDSDYESNESSLLHQINSILTRFSTLQSVLSGSLTTSTDFLFVNRNTSPNVLVQMAQSTRKVLENSIELKEQLQVAIYKNQKQTEVLKQKEKLIEQITVTKDTFIQKNEKCIENENILKQEIIHLNEIIKENGDKDEIINKLTSTSHVYERELTRLRKELKEYTNKDNNLSFMNMVNGGAGISEYKYNKMKKLMETWRSHALHTSLNYISDLPTLVTSDGSLYTEEGTVSEDKTDDSLKSINSVTNDLYKSINFDIVDISKSFREEKTKIASHYSQCASYVNDLSTIPMTSSLLSSSLHTSISTSVNIDTDIHAAQIILPTQNRHYANTVNNILVNNNEFINIHNLIIN